MDIGSRDDERSTPLLGGSKRSGALSLVPLYVLTFFQCVVYTIAMMPAFSLRFRELALSCNFDAALTATSYGRLQAVRNVVEFVATPMLTSWSDRVGRRRVLLLCCGIAFLQYTVLALSPSLLIFSASYVVFGMLADSNGALESTCIADATPEGSARAVAFGRLFTVIGAALVFGPVLGGHLAGVDGRAPFALASVLGLVAFVYACRAVPEYSSAKDRRASTASPAAGKGATGLQPPAMLRDFSQLLLRSPSLVWYIAAHGLVTMSMATFSSTQALWLREHLGWDGRQVGIFISTAGFLLMFSQAVLLPLMLKLFNGREALLSSSCLLILAARYVAYGLSPSGPWLYVAQLVLCMGSCGAGPLRSLCSKSAAGHQGALSGGMSALSTAVSIVGSLAGSQLFATSLRGEAPLGSCFFLAAACCIVGAACVARGAYLDRRRNDKKPSDEALPREEEALGA